MKNNKSRGVLYSGQAVIIVLLIMVIALTVGISISLRSSTNTRLSTRTEESQRAFSAAEAGLEAALIAGTGTISNSSFGANSSYSATKSSYGGGKNFSFPEPIARDDTQQVWFVYHDSNGNLDFAHCNEPMPPGDYSKTCYNQKSVNVCWGNSTATDQPALEATLIYLDTSSNTYKIKKYAVDAISRTPVNNFITSTVSSSGVPCKDLLNRQAGVYWATLDWSELPSGIQNIALRLRLMYNSANQALAVNSASDFPYQGDKVESTGTVAGTSGTNQAEVRKLNFYKSYPYLPGIFDFALFSSNALVK